MQDVHFNSPQLKFHKLLHEYKHKPDTFFRLPFSYFQLSSTGKQNIILNGKIKKITCEARFALKFKRLNSNKNTTQTTKCMFTSV